MGKVIQRVEYVLKHQFMKKAKQNMLLIRVSE